MAPEEQKHGQISVFILNKYMEHVTICALVITTYLQNCESLDLFYSETD